MMNIIQMKINQIINSNPEAKQLYERLIYHYLSSDTNN